MFTRVPLLLAALGAAVVAAPAPACDPPPIVEIDPAKPKPAPTFPHLATVVALDGKSGTIEYTVVVPVLVRVPFREVPGKFGTDVFVLHWENRKITRTAKIEQLHFADATGRRLTTDEVWKRLNVGTEFFVSADGNPVSEAHRKLLAKDALVAVDLDNVLIERLLWELLQPGAIKIPDVERPRPLPEPKG